MAFSVFAKVGKGGAKAGFRVMLKYFEIKGFSLLYTTNRFLVAFRLLKNSSQKTSKCGKNITDTFYINYITLILHALMYCIFGRD